MFITKKRSQKEYLAMSGQYHLEIERLEAELRAARDLRIVLDKLASSYACFSSAFSQSGEMRFPDSVAQYVNDHFGGQCIKQEATKVIEIEPDGTVKTGLTTKKQPDAGFTYVLNRKTN